MTPWGWHLIICGASMIIGWSGRWAWDGQRIQAGKRDYGQAGAEFPDGDRRDGDDNVGAAAGPAVLAVPVPAPPMAPPALAVPDDAVPAVPRPAPGPQDWDYQPGEDWGDELAAMNAAIAEEDDQAAWAFEGRLKVWVSRQDAWLEEQRRELVEMAQRRREVMEAGR